MNPFINFSEALRALKLNQKITRESWRDRSKFVVYHQGYPEGIGINKNTSEALSIPEGSLVSFQPYLMLHTTEGCVPWVATQSDLLADDWLLIFSVP